MRDISASRIAPASAAARRPSSVHFWPSGRRIAGSRAGVGSYCSGRSPCCCGQTDVVHRNDQLA
eukprot:109464-Prorocentrum_minimum.AAC.2